MAMWSSISHPGPIFPRRHPKPAEVFFIGGWIPVLGLGLAVGLIKDSRRGWTIGALLAALALVLPLVAATLLPGVKQPSQYPILGRPWLAVSAAPDGTFDLYLMRGDAQHLTALGETPWTEGLAELAPNRRHIVFPSNRYGSNDLFEVGLDGSGNPIRTHRLTDGPGNELSPAWSPDGTTIAYDTQVGGSSTIDLIGADGERHMVLTSVGGDAISPAWSTDGRSIAYSASDPERGGSDILIMRADGSDPRDVIDASSIDWSPHWSPNGRAHSLHGDLRTELGRVSRERRRFGHPKPHSWLCGQGRGVRLVAGRIEGPLHLRPFPYWWDVPVHRGSGRDPRPARSGSDGSFGMSTDAGSEPPVRTKAMLSPWPARILILLGSAGVALGTAMPWVSIGYLGGQFHLTEWDVTYLHWPHFVAGIVPLSGAVVAFGIGFLTGRRRIFLHRALAPIAVVFTELGFHYFVYRFGHLGAQIQAIPGVPSSRLGVGFY